MRGVEDSQILPSMSLSITVTVLGWLEAKAISQSNLVGSSKTHAIIFRAGASKNLAQRFLVQLFVTYNTLRPDAQLHVQLVMAEGDFRVMTPLYDSKQ